MDAALKRLAGKLSDVRGGLDFARNLDASLAASPTGEMQQLAGAFAGPAQRKRFFYAAAIIGMYGVHERFVLELAEGVARTLNRLVPTYEQLPETLRGSHLDLSLRALSAPPGDRMGGEVEANKILAQLHGCLSGRGGYELNAGVFTLHTANLRHKLVREMLRRVDVPVPEKVDDVRIGELLEGPLVGLFTAASDAIDDLAERRNEVAHGRDSELLDLDTLAAIADLVEAYLHALHRCAENSVLRHALEIYGKVIGTVTRTFTGPAGIRSVASFDLEAGRLEVGDVVVVRRGDSVVATRIATMQRNKKDRRRCDAGVGSGPIGIDVGVRVEVGAEILQLRGKGRALAAGLC